MLSERLSQIRHVALDMDGTVYLSDTLFPWTIPFLEKLDSLGIGYSFLTNNPTKSVDDYLKKLHGMGIKATHDQMYTTTIAMADYLHTHMSGAKRLFILGTPSMVSQMEAAGFEQCSESPDDVPDALVVSFDMTLQYSRLCRAAWWAKQGIPYLATNPDKVCPTDQRTVLVDCGSICKCIEYATGRKPDIVLGKPDPQMLKGIELRHGLAPENIAMVGDRLYTDIAMGRNAGALSVLVLSGESTLDDVATAPQQWQPDLICKNVGELGDLLEKYHGKAETTLEGLFK